MAQIKHLVSVRLCARSIYVTIDLLEQLSDSLRGVLSCRLLRTPTPVQGDLIVALETPMVKRVPINVDNELLNT